MLKFTDDNEVIQNEIYNAILVGLQINEEINYYMEELESLADAANMNAVAQMIQKLEKPNSATFIGKGKVQELKEFVVNLNADIVVFNNELSGMQIRNLEELLDVKVIDRTILILDIFAKRALSKEGKLQVELAQLQYRIPRLMGFGKNLSRLGAGIGTRGPGEKKLETDKRHIRRRIDDIRKELEDIKKNRQTQRKKREKKEIPIVALVGYTNAGKSAIMNRFLNNTEKDDKIVFEKNMLFATLDTSQRNISFSNNKEFILIDTVGFVSKLPHGLINAFKSTLEEVKNADLIVHVVDASFEEYPFYMKVTEAVLKDIGIRGKEMVTVYNKIDIVANKPQIELEEGIFISAKTGEGFDVFESVINEKIFSDIVEAKLLIPYNKGDIVSVICENANVIEIKYEEHGTQIMAQLKKSQYNRWREYVVI